MFTIAHISDQHWDQERLEKCLASAAFIEKTVNDLQPDLIVCSGDLQNRRQYLTGSSAVIPMMYHMIKLAAVAPVAMVYGNAEHDPPGSLDFLPALQTAFPIWVADRPTSITLMSKDFYRPEAADVPEAQALIHLLPYPTKQWFLAGKENLSIDESNTAIQEGLRGILRGFGALSLGARCPVILVAHCNVSGSKLSTGQTLLGQDIMISKHDLALAGAGYTALGHIHLKQEPAPGMRYAGSTYHNNFGEPEEKSFNVVTFADPSTLTINEIPIPSRPLSLHECTFEQGLLTDERIDERDWIDADLRVRVTLEKKDADLLTDKMIEEKYSRPHSLTIERMIVPSERIRSSAIVKARTLGEKVAEWGKTSKREIAPEVLELASDTERGCAQ